MLWWFMQNMLVAGLLAGLVRLACGARRLSPAVRHALWLIVLLKLVTPPLFAWPWSLPNVLDRPALRPAISAGHAGAAMARKQSSVPGLGLFDLADHSAGQADVAASMQLGEPSLDEDSRNDYKLVEFPGAPSDADDVCVQGNPGAAEAVRNSDARFAEAGYDAWLRGVVQSVGRIVLGFWLLGTCLSAVVHGIQIARFVRILARAQHAPQALIQRVHQLATTLRVRAPSVSIVSQLQSPVIWGGLRTRLVWPESLATGFDSGHWDGVIAHELAHLRRGDHWIGWLELAAGCAYWWNPLFWYVRHQLRENSELACDALVVWALPDGRRRYAASLIEVVSHLSQRTAPIPVRGIHSVARQNFERRLTMILSERVPSKLSFGAILVITVLGLATLPSWSQAQAPATTSIQQPTSPDNRAAAPVLGPRSAIPLNEVQLPAASEPLNAAIQQQLISVYEPVATQVADPSLNDDARIEALEKKLESLINEVKALRTSRSASVRSAPPVAQNWLKRQTTNQLTSDVQTLSRAQYRLPQAKAEAMAAFLREHMKSPVEAKVDGDTLVVTASPQAQAVIGQFVALSEGLEGAAMWPQSQYPVPNNLQNIYQRQLPAKQAAPATPSQPAKPVEPGTTPAPKRNPQQL